MVYSEKEILKINRKIVSNKIDIVPKDNHQYSIIGIFTKISLKSSHRSIMMDSPMPQELNQIDVRSSV